MEIPVGCILLLAVSWDGANWSAIAGGLVLGVVRSGSLIMLLTAFAARATGAGGACLLFVPHHGGADERHFSGGYAGANHLGGDPAVGIGGGAGDVAGRGRSSGERAGRGGGGFVQGAGVFQPA